MSRHNTEMAMMQYNNYINGITHEFCSTHCKSNAITKLIDLCAQNDSAAKDTIADMCISIVYTYAVIITRIDDQFPELHVQVSDTLAKLAEARYSTFANLALGAARSLITSRVPLWISSPTRTMKEWAARTYIYLDSQPVTPTIHLTRQSASVNVMASLSRMGRSRDPFTVSTYPFSGFINTSIQYDRDKIIGIQSPAKPPVWKVWLPPLPDNQKITTITLPGNNKANYIVSYRINTSFEDISACHGIISKEIQNIAPKWLPSNLSPKIHTADFCISLNVYDMIPVDRVLEDIVSSSSCNKSISDWRFRDQD